MTSKAKNAANASRSATGRILGAAALATVLISGAIAKADTTIVSPSNVVTSG